MQFLILLKIHPHRYGQSELLPRLGLEMLHKQSLLLLHFVYKPYDLSELFRSEERRVGKECYS